MDMEIELGSEAISYIKDQLSQGLTLANHLLTTCDLEAGKVVTFLPTGTDLVGLREFEQGILPTPPESEWVQAVDAIGQQFVMKPVHVADGGLVRTVQDFLRASKNRLCIFENRTVLPSDPHPERLRSRVVIRGNEVYHLLGSEDADEKTIRNTVKEARSYLEIGAMTSTPVLDALLAKKEITADELKTLALNTQKIVVGAYDGEGYLIWSRP